MSKERWSSQRAFIIAALGGAIGIGNLWRFPYLCYDNGGGAFLVPYFIALLTCGIPLLILEFGLGFKTDRTPIVAFNKVFGKKFEWIGWLAALVAFSIITYYVMLIAWGIDYIGFTAAGSYSGDAAGFFVDFASITDGFQFVPSSIDLMVVAGLAIVWAWIYISIRKGVESVEKMVWITVLLPFLIIAIFMGYGLTLEGASTGLEYYLSPDFSNIGNPDVWLAAYSQIFFTLSLGMGYSIAYASFLPRKSSIMRNSLMVGFLNSATSFLLGIGVFSVVGYLAAEQGVPVPEVAGSGGIGLVFLVFPTVINLLPYAAVLFGIMFFSLFVTLGIDSAFALTEGFTSAIAERLHLDSKKAIYITLGIAGITSLWFATDAGLGWLDVIDHYIEGYVLVLCGLCEIIAVSFFYGGKFNLRSATNFRNDVNKASQDNIPWLWNLLLYFSIAALSWVLISTLLADYETHYGAGDGYPAWTYGVGMFLFILVPVLAIVFSWLSQRVPIDAEADEEVVVVADSQSVDGGLE